MSKSALLNGVLLANGVINALPTEPDATASIVSPVSVFRNDVILAVIESANDPEIARLEQELQARKEAVALPVLVERYSKTMSVQRFDDLGTPTTKDVVDVAGASAYASDLISVRANLRDKFNLDMETAAPHLHEELESIKRFLNGLGLSTQYNGPKSIQTIAKVAKTL